MRTLFADAHYWVALLNPRDQWHRAARRAAAEYASARLVTTEAVLVELLNFFAAFRWEHSDRILRGCLPSHQGQPPAAGRPVGALGASRGSDHACRKGSVGREKHR